ncbi:MAG: hypothetical protein IJH63_04510 [Methanobrevibacter sp.]|nr:hypothetical protein [Methanobrevibacter sp.]
MKSVTAKNTNINNDLKECFALWEQTSKDGKTEYLSGKTSGDNPFRIVGFYRTVKKNPKQPDIIVFEKVEKGKDRNQVASLWETTSKVGKAYLTGHTNSNEKIIAFYNDNTEDGKYPYIRAYYKD